MSSFLCQKLLCCNIEKISFLENERKKMFDLKENEYIYIHADISKMKDFPKQKDGINCVVYTLLHVLVQCFKGNEMIDLD